MFLINRKEYIFKLSTGQVVNIFFRQKAGIFLSTLNKENMWVIPSLVTDRVLSGFSACIDKYDNIHILCQDINGGLVHVSNTRDTWDRNQILKNRRADLYDKHPYITSFFDKLYMIYTIKHGGNMLLTLHTMEGSKSCEQPEVVDCIEYSKRPYTVCSMNNSIYVFYSRKGDSCTKIGYREYDVSVNKWSDFLCIVEMDERSNVLSASPDHFGNLHLWWQKGMNQEFQLAYSKMDRSMGKWENSKVISTSAYPYNNSAHVVINNSIVYYYGTGDEIYCWISTNNGNTWSKRERYSFYDGKPKHCIVYSSNADDGNKNIFFNEIPATISPGYKMAFIEDISKWVKDKNSSEDNISCQDNSADMEEYDMKIKEIEEKSCELDNKISEVNIKVDKCEIRNRLMEKEVAKIKKQVSVIVGRLVESRGNAHSEDRQEGRTSADNKSSRAFHSPVSINKTEDRAMMPGSGFSHITPEYLKNLKDEH